MQTTCLKIHFYQNSNIMLGKIPQMKESECSIYVNSFAQKIMS